MQFTAKQMAKARTAKSVEELLKIAKESGMELTEEQAKQFFAELHKTGELSDDELDAVAGGNKGGPQEYYTKSNWKASDCECNAFWSMDACDSRTCGNCYRYKPSATDSSEGVCRRDFE